VRWLAGFAAVTAGPDEEVVVEIPVAARRFQHWDGGWVTEPGTFVLYAGSSAGDLPLRTELVLD
jgi:beta-glucosidase